MKTTVANEEKMKAVNELVKNLANLFVVLTADGNEAALMTEQPESIKAIPAKTPERVKELNVKPYTVTTKKYKCKGVCPNAAYSYSINVTDGINTATFDNYGLNCLELKDCTGATNKYNSRFWMQRRNPGVLHYMRGFGNKGNELKEQKEEMLEFIKSCLNIPIKYVDEEDGVFTYSYANDITDKENYNV